MSFRRYHKVKYGSRELVLIDIAKIRESCSTGDLTNVAHILSKFNIADTLTKEAKDDNLFCQLIETGKINHPVNQWILPS